MTKRERVLSATRRGPVDRPPVSFWRHVPDVDHTAAGLADAMLAFQRKWDLDFVKVMSSGVYCVEDWGCRVAYQGSPNGAKQCTEHGVRERKDWARVRPLDEGKAWREMIHRYLAGTLVLVTVALAPQSIAFPRQEQEYRTWLEGESLCREPSNYSTNKSRKYSRRRG